MMNRMLFVLLLVLQNIAVLGQVPPAWNSSEVLLQIEKLKVLGSVLYIAAHPDDENTRLLGYLAKERQYRTGYLSITRGDGGQNLIGDEQGVELGMIRTQELMAARRADGAEQFFTRAYDFGFSKSTEEALRIWDQEKILSDVVWVIRKFQPDVIITRFPPDSRAGHGHHSASAVLAQLAFEAAADPARFPEQFNYGVQPWKAKRLLWNTFNFGNTNTTASDQFKLDVGVFNPLVGKSYGELASESRSQHKSQGFGVPRQRGQSFEYFTHVAGESFQNDILDGVVTNWKRFNAEGINKMIDVLLQKYKMTDPSSSVPQLIALYKAIEKVNDGDWKRKKMEELQQLIEAASGLWLEATTAQSFVVNQDSLQINFSTIARTQLPVKLLRVQLDTIPVSNIDTVINTLLSTNLALNFNRR
ncbi:MAG: PIG-L family deacetylase, partial [Bacteroidetes bacterium]|nr:PIG-L family deacetylase [Bacteroidota bacterium]